jgi:hypothetical protein
MRAQISPSSITRDLSASPPPVPTCARTANEHVGHQRSSDAFRAVCCHCAPVDRASGTARLPCDGARGKQNIGRR